MLKGILHIGMPKCMSTSLQSFLLEAKNVYFAGIGPSKHVRGDMLLAFQRQIVRTPTQFYNRDFVANIFGEYVKQARERSAEFFALSDETIPFPLGYARADTSYVERLMRLKAVMPQPTTVLMIVRRPADYLKSTYKYRVAMNGMSFSYEEYLKRLLLLGDTNLLCTVKYGHFAEAAKQVFGAAKVVAMEDIEKDERALLEIFAVPDLNEPVRGRLPRENSGMPSAKFANFREVHRPFGNTLDDDDFNVMTPADRIIAQSNPHYAGAISGALAKEHALTALRNIAAGMPDRAAEPSFEISDETRTLLTDYVSQANAQLKRLYGVATDEYGYDRF